MALWVRSYLRDAFQEGSADAVGCLPRAKAFSCFILFAWWSPVLFLLEYLNPSIHSYDHGETREGVIPVGTGVQRLWKQYI
jgi:hypothetical protein